MSDFELGFAVGSPRAPVAPSPTFPSSLSPFAAPFAAPFPFLVAPLLSPKALLSAKCQEDCPAAPKISVLSACACAARLYDLRSMTNDGI